MWHSDKLLVQEELAKNISELIFAFTGEKRENLQTIEPEKALCFVASFLRLMETEWNSIDHDRYLFLCFNSFFLSVIIHIYFKVNIKTIITNFLIIYFFKKNVFTLK